MLFFPTRFCPTLGEVEKPAKDEWDEAVEKADSPKSSKDKPDEEEESDDEEEGEELDALEKEVRPAARDCVRFNG